MYENWPSCKSSQGDLGARLVASVALGRELGWRRGKPVAGEGHGSRPDWCPSRPGPPRPLPAVPLPAVSFACWQGQQQGGTEKLSCPRVTFNVVGCDCGLRPDVVFLAYGFLLLMSTEKLQIFTLPVQAVFLEDLKYWLHEFLLFSYISIFWFKRQCA